MYYQIAEKALFKIINCLADIMEFSESVTSSQLFLLSNLLVVIIKCGINVSHVC